MRKYSLLLVGLLGTGIFSYAQNKQLLYDFVEIPQSLLVNPGVETNFKWYAGIPLASQISFQIGTSGATVQDIFANDGVDFNTKLRERVVFGQTERDELSGTLQIELLSGGFRGPNPRDFYSFGLYQEGDGIGYWFRDLAILALDGNTLGRRFDLSHLKFRGELVSVFHFGINRKINKKLTVGARGKLYSSIFNFSSSRNKGFFETVPGTDNLLRNTINADLELRTSGVEAVREILRRDDDENNVANITDLVRRRALLGGDLGLGVDFGFTYKLDKQTVVTASVLDLGFIYHTTDVKTYTLQGNASVEGVEVIFPDILLDPDNDFIQEIIDEVEESVPFDSNENNYITFRPTRLNASIRRDFGKPVEKRKDCDCNYKVGAESNNKITYKNSFGGHLYMVNRPRGPQAALSAFYQHRVGTGLSLKASYTVDKFTFSNVGLGINLQAGPVNIYALADNLLSYQNLADTNYLSFQFGLNIISWGKKQ
ncbi:DUF5723 family protein [Spongiimicrobium salis]|uniref:DUF5723 family protein n=1 Tax=Spongiimicrobium salis TaxID=1667022 RepID=UPI00374D8D4C